MPGSPSDWVARPARFSHTWPWPNSPVQMSTRERSQRWGDHGLGAPIMPGGQRYGLFAAFASQGEGVDGEGVAEVGEAGHFR